MIIPKDIDLNILPCLPLEKKTLFPEEPAIYFAIDSLGSVQYIGRTTNIRNRWSCHHKYGELEQLGRVKIAYMLVNNPELLPQIESKLIAYFNPPLNVTGKERNQERKLLSAFIPVEIAKNFKVACIFQQVTLGEGLEQAISLWLEHLEKSKK